MHVLTVNDFEIQEKSSLVEISKGDLEVIVGGGMFGWQTCVQVGMSFAFSGMRIGGTFGGFKGMVAGGAIGFAAGAGSCAYAISQ